MSLQRAKPVILTQQQENEIRRRIFKLKANPNTVCQEFGIKMQRLRVVCCCGAIVGSGRPKKNTTPKSLS